MSGIEVGRQQLALYVARRGVVVSHLSKFYSPARLRAGPYPKSGVSSSTSASRRNASGSACFSASCPGSKCLKLDAVGRQQLALYVARRGVVVSHLSKFYSPARLRAGAEVGRKLVHVGVSQERKRIRML
jgi:hypothetical protein